jgi:hypothetical protein
MITTVSNDQLIESLAGALNLDLETLERIGQADRSYFEEAREKVLRALANWDQDQQIPVCFHCGSPRVDWFETVSDCGWRCQDCGSVEDAVAQGRKATRFQHPAQNKFCSERQTKGVNE